MHGGRSGYTFRGCWRRRIESVRLVPRRASDGNAVGRRNLREPVPVRPRPRFESTVQVELREDVLGVIANRGGTQVETLGHRLRVGPGSHQLEDLDLTSGEE